MSAPPDPHPISDSLNTHLTDALTRIEPDKKGQASIALTTAGVEAAIGTKLKKNVTLSGWAGREWKGRGWLAGARAGVSW